MRITIIGCGNMGGSFAQALSKTNQLSLYDHNFEKTEHLAKQGYGKAFKNIKEAISNSEIIILAIKPQNLKELVESIVSDIGEGQILVSMLTGTTLETLSEYFPKAQIVRIMPNLPIIYGEGVIGITAKKQVQKAYEDDLSKIFKVLGKNYWLPEEKMNALTALAGSGPAFFLTMIEAMVDAGIAMGFPATVAQDLTCQMLKGSLALLEKSCKHPAELKWQITSPQGTTIAGLKRLEESAVRAGIMNTFLAAYDRANQLSLKV